MLNFSRISPTKWWEYECLLEIKFAINLANYILQKILKKRIIRQDFSWQGRIISTNHHR